MQLSQVIKPIIIIGLVYAIIGVLALVDKTGFAGEGGAGATSCDIISSTQVVIGDDSSTEIVANHAQNAYVLITQPINATNTVSIGFDSAATTASGFVIGSSTATYHPSVLEVGLNTDFPFTGAVNAITNLASTTIGVTICRY